jgi:hypothetical protein
MNYSGWQKLGIPMAISAFLVFTLAGCGYTTRSMISNKYRTIYVTPFVNKVDITSEVYAGNKYKIYRPMLETDVTRAVNNKFLFDGNLKPTDKDSADLVLKGDLVDFRRDPLRYTDNNEVSEYRINIVVNISLWDNRENKLIWKEDNFTGDTTYFTTFYSVASERKEESVAVSGAINDLARRIVERAVEQW